MHTLFLLYNAAGRQPWRRCSASSNLRLAGQHHQESYPWVWTTAQVVGIRDTVWGRSVDSSGRWTPGCKRRVLERCTPSHWSGSPGQCRTAQTWAARPAAAAASQEQRPLMASSVWKKKKNQEKSQAKILQRNPYELMRIVHTNMKTFLLIYTPSGHLRWWLFLQ